MFALAVCGGGGAATPLASASPTSSRHAVSFDSVVLTPNSRQDGGATIVVGTNDQRTELIRSLVPTLVAPAEGRALVAAFDGQQQTGGYAVTVTSIERDGDALLVHASFSAPAPGAVVTEVLTSPAHVVSVASADLAGAKTAVLLDDTGKERARVTLT